jgi:hypothetical protein
MNTARPIYENAETLQAEKAFAESIEAVTGFELIKLPIKYQLDYAALEDDMVKAFLELKCRTNARNAYPDYAISLHKYLAAQSLFRATGIKTILAVRFTDGDFCAEIGELKGCRISFLKNGIRTREDSQDCEPMIHVPLSAFQKI